MSQLRRENQAARLSFDKPRFARRLILIAYKRWKQILVFLGFSEGLKLIQLLQEDARIKFVDWALIRLGSFGAWVAGFHFAFLVLAVIVIILLLIVAAIRESLAPKESIILDSQEKPYKVQRIPPWWSTGFSVIGTLLALVLIYGAYDYYRTLPLLDKYPLGYVIFDTDYVTSAATPLETRRGLEAYQFDFRPVRITQNTKD